MCFPSPFSFHPHPLSLSLPLYCIASAAPRIEIPTVKQFASTPGRGTFNTWASCFWVHEDWLSHVFWILIWVLSHGSKSCKCTFIFGEWFQNTLKPKWCGQKICWCEDVSGGGGGGVRRLLGADVTVRIWLSLMGVDWILPPVLFTGSFTHTQTELQCYSERVSCLNPRTESEEGRTRENRGEGHGTRGMKEWERDCEGGLKNSHYSLSTCTQRLLQFYILPPFNCSNSSWSTVSISALLRGAACKLQVCFCDAVCVMCCVVLVSAGRNVLDSVPPTHRPPTHGRLCIYTSGSSRSPQSFRSFKSLPCIYSSALVLFFSIIWLPQHNRHTETHTEASRNGPRKWNY